MAIALYVTAALIVGFGAGALFMLFYEPKGAKKEPWTETGFRA